MLCVALIGSILTRFVCMLIVVIAALVMLLLSRLGMFAKLDKTSG